MRKLKHLCVITFLFLIASCSKDDSPSPNDTDISLEILKLINEYRQGLSLSPLTINSTATSLSIDHTLYMIDKKQIGHDNFNDRFNKITKAEKATGFAENVASGQPTAKSVVDAWIASPGHKKNIEGDYTFTGIAAIKDENGKYYYTQLFYR